MNFFDFDSNIDFHNADKLYNAMKRLTPSQFKNIQEIIYDLINCK